MNKQLQIANGLRLSLEAALAFGILLSAMLFIGSANAGTGADNSNDLFTAAERADELGKDAELELYSKVLRATQGRGAYRLLIKTAQKCETLDGASG